MTNFAATSFIFLGCLQLSYRRSLIGMIIVYTLTSFAQTFKVLLAYWETDNMKDFIPSSGTMASNLKFVALLAQFNPKSDVKNSSGIHPQTVYEDLGRDIKIVLMVFLTQALMIAFVVRVQTKESKIDESFSHFCVLYLRFSSQAIDVDASAQNNCMDGTDGCPLGGTLGSWSFYIVGIFMACVFMLGPRSAFGQSAQNPAYWINLLVSTKLKGAKLTWFDPIKNKTYEHFLHQHDPIIWFRFWLSFLINGIGKKSSRVFHCKSDVWLHLTKSCHLFVSMKDTTYWSMHCPSKQLLRVLLVAWWDEQWV